MAQVIVPAAIGVVLSFGYSALNRSSTSNPLSEGTRADTSVPKSEYGWELQDFYGTCRRDSCLLSWGVPLREEEIRTKKKQRSGGKGGRSTTTTDISYNYYLTARYTIGGKIEGIKRVWANSELIYSEEDTGDKSEQFLEFTEIYLGTDDQNPSPTMESYKGVGNVSGYRNKSAIVFKDYPLFLIGERRSVTAFPRIDVEVLGQTTGEGSIRIKNCVLDICLKSGLTEDEVDISGMSNDGVVGYALPNNGNSYRQSIEDLQKLGFFIAKEERDKIYFFSKNTDSIKTTIPADSLAARRFGERAINPYLRKALNYQDLPSEVTISYRDLEKDHDQGTWPEKNRTATHYNQFLINLPVVERDWRIQKLASETLFELLTQNEKLEKIFLLPSWNGLEVGDLFALENSELDSLNLYQITKKIRGTNYLIEIEANKYNGELRWNGEEYEFDNFIIDIDDTITLPPRRRENTSTYGTAEIIPLDISLYDPTDTDFGIYAAVKGDDNWNGGAVYLSEDNGNTYDLVAGLSGRSVVGACQSVLPSHCAELIDRTNVLSVVMTGNEELDPVTESAFLAGKNYALIGSEIVAFMNATVTDNEPLTYEISYFIRGCFGTESAIATHQAGETFILLTDYIERLTGEVSDINKTFLLKAVASGQIEANVTSYSSITVAGESIKPYPPLPVYGSRDGSGNLTINWFRRTRKNGGLLDYADITYAEGELASYTVEILNAGVVVRSLTVTDTIASYPASDQTTDFGSPQSAIAVKIYQNSSYPVGRKNALIQQL